MDETLQPYLHHDVFSSHSTSLCIWVQTCVQLLLCSLSLLPHSLSSELDLLMLQRLQERQGKSVAANVSCLL